jgi:Phosphodiester glycosidase/SPOR domain
VSLRVMLICLLIALSLAAPAATAATKDANTGGLPLGKPGLKETRTTQQVAPGITYTRIVRGKPSKDDHYTVDVAFEADQSSADGLAAQLRSGGYEPMVQEISERAPDDPQTGPLGYLVRTGAFATQAEANALRDRLAADGYTGLRVVYTGEDGTDTTGPWVVHVLEIDPARYDGTLRPELATKIIPDKETLTSISARTGALAATNGGYFVVDPTDGTPGDLAGISVLRGQLASEAVDGRTSLLLPAGSGEGADIAALTDSLGATASDGARREVDGVNRAPGLIRACGGVGGDQPTESPKHDFTCTDESELIRFTPLFGATTAAGEGAEAVLDSTGRVVGFREERGGAIPPDGSVLSGTGDAADWLRAHAAPGTRVDVKTTIFADGAPLKGKTGVVNGGPRLLSNGSPDITAYAEGFVWPENPEFYYRFGVKRNPRTMAGIEPGGKLLLVAVDGHAPGYSVGASFKEEEAVMASLGAKEAVNLDGGGSTTMTVGGDLVNRPSDATGERPIGDAVVLLP